ncbi:MAG: hypothetical protein RI918_1516 [Pseudomonadota bacterium]|jgi:hypothetical protein
MDTVTTTNNSPAIHGRLDLPIRLPVLLPLLASLIITGCAAPMDARKDAQYQSNASVADRPTSRPTRSLSSMSPSLMCMDHMFRQADLPTTLITSKQIPDVTGKIAVATKDMIVTALSQMSRLSNAFRYIDYEVDISRQDTVQNMTAIMLNNNQMQLQKPALYVSGAVSFVDQNIISNHFEAGTSATRLETGYSTNKNATLIGLDLHMGDFKTRTIIPGLDSANEVVIGNASQGLDLAGKIGSYGVQFNVGRDYTQGPGAAIRTLVDLAMIELIGKWSRLPYWRCLTLDQTHPELQRQLRDWYDAGRPAAHSKLVKTALVGLGYMKQQQIADPDNTAAFKAILGKYQADAGMVVTGVIDFPTYERVMRNYTKLDTDGKLVPVDWTPSGDLKLAEVPRSMDLQIKNVQLDKTSFEVGDQIFLSTSVSRASHVYCYLQEATGNVLRLLPNATNTESLMTADVSVRIPDWINPKPGFILDAAAPGNEHVTCIATDEDVMPKLPAAMQVAAFKPIAGMSSKADVLSAFTQITGEAGLSQATVTWKVTPKTVKAAQK